MPSNHLGPYGHEMLNIVVVGGGVTGLLTGMVLADDGHRVEILERDPSQPTDPRQAWDDWERAAVRQFRLPHFLLPPFYQMLAANLPRVVDALDEAGALRTNPIASMPEALSGGWREGDERFESLTGTRPMVEAVLARCAAETEGLTVSRGVTVTGLIPDDSAGEGSGGGRGAVHIVGVETADGRRVLADLVIDAAGRASALPAHLRALGASAPVDEAEDSGFVYYARAFRSADGSLPAALGGGLQHHGSISTLTLGADNAMWGLALIASGGDKAMRRVRDVKVFDRVWRAHPLVAHWIDGVPASDGVVLLANVEDRIRRFVLEGEPVATGVLPVGDSWACTNPSVGRGISLAALQIVGLRDLLRFEMETPGALVTAWSEWLGDRIEPIYRETVAGDRHRLGQIDATLAGEIHTPDPLGAASDALTQVAFEDPELLRLWLDSFLMNRLRADLIGDDGVQARVLALAEQADPVPGPTRAELDALLAS